MQQETIEVLLKETVDLQEIFDHHVQLSSSSLTVVLPWGTLVQRNECLRFLRDKRAPLETLSLDLLKKLLLFHLVDFEYFDKAGLKLKLEPRTSIVNYAESTGISAKNLRLNSMSMSVSSNHALEILSRDKVRVTANRSSDFFSALESPSLHPLLIELLQKLNVITAEESQRDWAKHDEFFHIESRVIANPLSEGIAGLQLDNPGSTRISLKPIESLPIPFEEISQRPLDGVMKKRRSERGHSQAGKLSKSHLFQLCSYLLPSGASYFYPRAGGLNATRVYLYVKSAGDLREGLYFLNQDSRSMDLVSSEKLKKAFDLATLSWEQTNGTPHALLFITGDYHSMHSKYSNIAYRNLLLEAGCLAQLIQIAAAEVGLKSCLLGSGSVDLLSPLTGVSPSQECQLVELAIGI